MEQWVKEWVKEQRDLGVKCLEIKMQGKGHHVYHSTTYWDNALKKPRKTSKYLGMLDPYKWLIKSGGRHRIHPSDIRNITEYGNSMLLHETMSDLKPLLKEDFPNCWAEICAFDPHLNPKYLPRRCGDNFLTMETNFNKLLSNSSLYI